MKIKNFNNYGGQVNMADHIAKIEFTAPHAQERFVAFTETLHLTDDQTQAVQEICQTADERGLDESKVIPMLEQLNTQLDALKSQLPAPVVQGLEEVKKLQTGMGFDGKFKTSIPIIPFVLSYELEAKSNLKDLFKQIWQDMKNGEIFLKK